jgi:polyphosphate kinase 2
MRASAGPRAESVRATLPKVLTPEADAPAIRMARGAFDLDDPVLPDWIETGALSSGGYPYAEEMGRSEYERLLHGLQIELVKLQNHIAATGIRIVTVFEGRDAAGKGGTILAIREFMNPRAARMVALPKPSERERGEWYFQRYAAHLPTSGEVVLFDRSWYNRAGVEPVMGFCTPGEYRQFLVQAPVFEAMVAEAGIVVFKFWLDIGREMQLKQFHQRRHDPLKVWKLSSIDYAAMEKWDEYTRARDRMFAATHKPGTPWTVALFNDKRRGRLAVIRRVLSAIPYRGKDAKVVGRPDPAILGAPSLLRKRRVA